MTALAAQPLVDPCGLSEWSADGGAMVGSVNELDAGCPKALGVLPE
jgi:hypothetical protein